MRVQQFTIYFATFLVGCYAIPNSQARPDAFDKVIVGRQNVGGVSRQRTSEYLLLTILTRTATSPGRALIMLVMTSESAQARVQLVVATRLHL